MESDAGITYFIWFNNALFYSHKTILIIILINTKNPSLGYNVNAFYHIYLLIVSLFPLSYELLEVSGHISHLFYIPHSFQSE